jgi:Phosphoribulokinase / Uridine kinase family
MGIDEMLYPIKQPMSSNLSASMLTIQGLIKLMGDLFELLLTAPLKQLLNILVKIPLIAFEQQSHCKVYMETSTHSIRFHRRMIRDIKERGDTKATVATAWATNVMPMHQRYVVPQREHADIVVPGEADVRQSLKQVFRACALPELVALKIC